MNASVVAILLLAQRHLAATPPGTVYELSYTKANMRCDVFMLKPQIKFGDLYPDKKRLLPFRVWAASQHLDFTVRFFGATMSDLSTFMGKYREYDTEPETAELVMVKDDNSGIIVTRTIAKSRRSRRRHPR